MRKVFNLLCIVEKKNSLLLEVIHFLLANFFKKTKNVHWRASGFFSFLHTLIKKMLTHQGKFLVTGLQK